MERTHASFFSGVGGLNLGLERAGWRTVSFSEIDPYACAVLGERWPGVPNLGDITALAADERASVGRRHGAEPDDGRERDGRPPRLPRGTTAATLWTGGFPCQDLSVAGKRRGLAGARSGLAFAFLDLVERYRPPAIILENVPGLLSSHGGRDLGALAHRLGQLGYGWAYRVLDAQHFGVPQRRRRVFICALHLERGFGPDSAAEVLSVGSRCGRHPAAGVEAGPGAAEPARGGVDIARAVTGTSGKRHDEDTDTLVPAVRSNPYGDHISDEPRLVLGSPPDAGRMRKTHELARGLDYRSHLAEEAIDAADQASTAAILRGVWPASGEEALQHAAGGLRGLSAEEVLRCSLHGEELRQAAQRGEQPEGEDGPLPRKEDGPAWAVLAMLQAERAGRASRQLGPQRQPAREPDPAVPELSSPYPSLAPTLRVDPARSEDGGPGDTVPIIAATLNSGGNDGGFRTEPGEHLLIGTLREHVRPGSNTDHTVLAFNPYRTLERDGSVTSGYAPRPVIDALHGPTGNKEPLFVTADGIGYIGPLLPLGLDSHRYRCCGNGVVADVSEWIGHRLAEVMR